MLPAGLPVAQGRALAAELTGLSQALWRCYTHPASAADSLAVNTEGWRREQTRNKFGSVVDHIRRPNLPDEHGSLEVAYDPVEERANLVGRCLHRAADADLSSTSVITEVEAELAAVERAELGDLSGRAVQAVQLTRQDASPVQVAAADQLLAANPLGDDDLFLELDPTSACVAAAHWLQAAAEVVAEVSGIAVTMVVEEADNIEALPHATPTAVLELMEIGLPPTAVVTGMIGDAMVVVGECARHPGFSSGRSDGQAAPSPRPPGCASLIAATRLPVPYGCPLPPADRWDCSSTPAGRPTSCSCRARPLTTRQPSTSASSPASRLPSLRLATAVS